ncbi:MAG: exo-alpha-sialidase [Planctomycetota bacterium]
MNVTSKTVSEAYMPNPQHFAPTCLVVFFSFFAMNANAGVDPLPPMLNLVETGVDPSKIDYDALPTLAGSHAVVSQSDAEWKFRLHNYLVHHDGKYWCMWSHGPVIEDNPTQHVRYATSDDGIHWSNPLEIMPPSPEKGFRYIARGFWLRDGQLLALASHDEAFNDEGKVHFFGKSLELLAWQWERRSRRWRPLGPVFPDCINNYPPERLSDGTWGMICRDHRRRVFLLTGGVDDPHTWRSIPVVDYVSPDGFRAEEPTWWLLPNRRLLGLFRDNSKSGRLYRALSQDHGQTWTKPEKTNFPDATSKFFGIRTSRGQYVLISNTNPQRRNPLCLSLSKDGITFTHMGRLPVPSLQDQTATDAHSHYASAKYDSLQYPHAIENNGSLWIAFSRRKQSIEVVKVPLAELDKLTTGQ